MSPTPIKFPNDPPTEFPLFSALGLVPGVTTVNKFGSAPQCSNGVLTDVWDGADAVTSQPIYVPPTQPRIHDIVSTSTNDTDGGTGMHSVRIFGLPSWDDKEISEDLILNGTTNVPTVNSYVIIHRMFGVAAGTGQINEGRITATAQTDATITAIIQADEGQTLMAIYGVPRNLRVVLITHTMELFKTVGGGATAIGRLTGIFNPDLATDVRLTKDIFSVDESNDHVHTYLPPVAFTGPLLIKNQVTTDTNNVRVTAGFTLYVVDL